jgi:hypothetical protein
MTFLGILLCFLFFSITEVINFFVSASFFVFDIQVPITIFFAFYYNDYRLYLIAMFFGLLSGITQGHAAFFILFYAGIAYLLHISKDYFMISSLRFITAFTFIAELIKTVLLYCLIYKGSLMPKLLFSQIFIYVLANALVSSVFYEAFSKIFCKMKMVYEKGFRYT